NELRSGCPMEIGLRAGSRSGLQLVEAPIQRSGIDLSRDDVVVVSGGARGVTAEAVVALARAAQPTLVILGRSPEPAVEPSWLASLDGEAQIKRAILDEEFGGNGNVRIAPAKLEAAYRRHMANREIRRNLDRMHEAGASAIYRSVDVRDADAVRTVLEDVRREFGPIKAIVHGAGVLADRRIEDKAPGQFDAVFDTKVDGLQSLLDGVQTAELSHLVLFSSVSARFGNPGQADYAMANEVLNKTAQRFARRHTDCRTIALNWGPWDGGMVTPGLKRAFEQRGVSLISTARGAAAFVDEFAAAQSDHVEIVLGDGLPPAEGGMGTAETIAAPAIVGGDDWSVVMERTLDVESHSFLRSHVLGGRPVLPLAVMMEWLAHGALHGNPGLCLAGVNEMRVLKGVVVPEESYSIQILTDKTRRDRSEHAVDVMLRSTTDNGDGTIHARATVVLADAPPPAPAYRLPRDWMEHADSMDVDQAYRLALFHGPELRAIDEINGCAEAGVVARLRTAPAPTAWMTAPPRTNWIADPLVLDGGLQLGLVWSHQQMATASLPTYVAAYRQYRRAFPTGDINTVLEIRETTPHKLVGDLTFLDGSDAVVAQMTGCAWTLDAALAAAFAHEPSAHVGS
ncbi:MAG: SDR family NAD(P)-dependent oxidoreductase, partial [Phycisphaerae bacterium]